MRGLDPRIHDAADRMTVLRKVILVERLMGRRVIGERSDAVLRPAMPGDDGGVCCGGKRALGLSQNRSVLQPALAAKSLLCHKNYG